MNEPLIQARESFRFYTRLNLLELTGVKARNIQELLILIEKSPDSVVYHHTHHFLQQHVYLSPEPPNDFAYWVKGILGDYLLAEQLASIDIYDFNSLKELKEKICSVIKNYIPQNVQCIRAVPLGKEFNFIKAVTFVLPTLYQTKNLAEFLVALKKVTIHSLYFHIFESRLRLKQPTNDFSYWLETSLGEKKIADALNRLDPYTHTMEGLRKKICELIENRIADC
ncbi:MAG: hypothetical protein KAS70_03190 [Planctomycetes bacterium]|nr:hypothetical protein [Planctomycetota bacterium]